MNLRIPERLSKTEISDLIAHINSLGIWTTPRITTEDFWQDYLESNFGRSFFDTIYHLVEPTRPSLEESVWTEFENLTELGKKAYRLTAAMHQFGISIKMEVLMRALGADFPTFETEIVRGDAQSVLVTEHLSSHLNLFLRGRTRMISQIVFDRAVPESTDQLALFKQIISATEPGEMFGTDELDAIRTLLVQVLGPKGFDSRFSWEEQAELFDAATSNIEDDVLEHHFGLVEIKANRKLSAWQRLERSLQLTAELPHDLSIQRESPQNVENSLAMVIGQLAIEAAKRGSSEAERLFEDSRQHFLNARFGQFPNAAAYDAHARILKSRADLMFKKDTKRRVQALGEAMGIVTEGIDNVSPQDRPILVALRTEFLEELGQEREAIAELASRAEVGAPEERAQYHVILAELYTSKEVVKQKDWRRAFEHACRAVELDSKFFKAQKIRAQSYQK